MFRRSFLCFSLWALPLVLSVDTTEKNLALLLIFLLIFFKLLLGVFLCLLLLLLMMIFFLNEGFNWNNPELPDGKFNNLGRIIRGKSNCLRTATGSFWKGDSPCVMNTICHFLSKFYPVWSKLAIMFSISHSKESLLRCWKGSFLKILFGFMSSIALALISRRFCKHIAFRKSMGVLQCRDAKSKWDLSWLFWVYIYICLTSVCIYIFSLVKAFSVKDL